MQSSLLAMRAVRYAARPALFNTARAAYSANIAGGSMGKAWADKEHAHENQYFNQEDARKLAELAKKLHVQTTVCHPHHHPVFVT